MSTHPIDTKTYNITTPLWGGSRMFKHGTNEPWVGVAEEKLQTAEKVNLLLAYKRGGNTVIGVDAQAFLQISSSKGWKNKNGKAECYYLPESMLMSISEGVRA